MKFIYAEYNMYHNRVEITTFDGYLLRIDCNKAEDGLTTTPCSQCALDALAIDEPLDICNPSIYRWIYSTLREICRCGWMQRILWNFTRFLFYMCQDH